MTTRRDFLGVAGRIAGGLILVPQFGRIFRLPVEPSFEEILYGSARGGGTFAGLSTTTYARWQSRRIVNSEPLNYAWLKLQKRLIRESAGLDIKLWDAHTGARYELVD